MSSPRASLHVAASRHGSTVGWAWVLVVPGEAPVEGSGAMAEASTSRGELQAVVDGLARLVDGAAVEVRTANDNLRQTGTSWLQAWRAAGWQRKGGIKNLDLVQALAAQLDRMQVMFALEDDPHVLGAKQAKARARAAREVLPSVELPTPPSPAVEAARARLVAYTDGGCRRSQEGVGGWGFLLVDTRSGVALEGWGGELGTTNNRMEMTAALQVLAALKSPGQHVELRTDSTYLRDLATKWLHAWRRYGWTRWNGEPIANLDLVQELDRLQRQHRVVWTWVRGHAGEPGNEHVDRLASRGMDAAVSGGPAAEHARHEESPVRVPAGQA